MDKKRENVLFPLGFNSLPITALAYNMRFRTEVDQKLAEMKTQLESEFNTKLEKIESELKIKIYNEIYEKLSEEIRRHDGWEKVDQEPEK